MSTDLNLEKSRVPSLAVIGVFLLAAGAASDGQSSRERAPMTGVSIAGPEFGSHRPEFSNVNRGKPGIDYTYNRQETVAYFAAKGMRFFRLPLRWERLQPRLSGDLDQQELVRLRAFLGWVRSGNGKAILDLHNYGRYRTKSVEGKVVECIIDERINGHTYVSRNDFADFWRKMSAEFHDHPAIYGYGLMNEPHHMGLSSWKLISQAAVRAVRDTGDKTLLLVAGDEWSNPENWARANGASAWIDDPLRQIAYEAHCYFDDDASGKYRLSYDEELAKDPRLHERGRRRVTPFIDWCARNRVRGVIGEFATPRDDRWRKVLTPFLESVRDSNMDAAWWAAGDWWGDYPMSLQPSADFRTPAPQLAWILRAPTPPPRRSFDNYQ